MYPLLRYYKALRHGERLGPLGLFEPHINEHICWPWDTDPWRELNNGRTLTLYDLGRVPMGRRMGLNKIMREEGFAMAVAGSAVRYRARVAAFQRLTMISRLLGWDGRFLYMEQTMWLKGACTSQLLVRTALTKRGVKGIVPPQTLIDKISPGQTSPELGDWVKAWIASEDKRPWPPESERYLPR